MGACNSCEATAVAAVNGSGAAVGEATAARVVLADGELQRFPGGTRASQAVKAAAAAAGSGGAGACFLCSADGLELGGAVAAVAGDEELQPGQLYFVLPAAMRRRPLQAEEMAALAVRASAALVGDHGGGPLVFPDSASAAAAGNGAAAARKAGRRRSRRTASRGRDFVPDLGAIAE
ncbi:uncharacterized protein LOC100825662 [Brachypodium distachyon]|nr:uncharacterized protein LOC100825662 [Brachypodium distachyon]|eukprot:XP_003559921.1 uncharacterized protein LOC100825662 [Brachypodium distachyon]